MKTYLIGELELHKVYLCVLSRRRVIIISDLKTMGSVVDLAWNNVTGYYDTIYPYDNQLTDLTE